MEIYLWEEKRLAEVWLTRRERDDPAVARWLKPLYAAYRRRNYLVAVYLSGEEGLYPCTRDLLVRQRNASFRTNA